MHQGVSHMFMNICSHCIRSLPDTKVPLCMTSLKTSLESAVGTTPAIPYVILQISFDLISCLTHYATGTLAFLILAFSDTAHLLLSHGHGVCFFLCPECSFPKPLHDWLFHHSAMLNCNFLRHDFPCSHSLTYITLWLPTPMENHCIYLFITPLLKCKPHENRNIFF